MDEIDSIEYEWIESCNNAGLNYCSPGKYDCYGYDYSSQYPSKTLTIKYDPKHKYYIRSTKTNSKGNDLCELVNSRKPCHFSIARIKPFFTCEE